MDISKAVDYVAYWVLGCSILSNLLPPVEFFEDFPNFQKWYRMGCKILKYLGSLDWRGKIIAQYPSYQKTLAGQIQSPFADKQ